MDQENRQVPARPPRSATRPEDLHVPEHEPPSMPEAADTPDQLNEHPEPRAIVSGSGAPAPNRAASTAESATTPEQLHAPEHEPPSMPEVADTPDQPAE